MKKFTPSFLFLFPVLLFAQNNLDTLQLVGEERVFFDFGKYDLRPEADSVLELVKVQCEQIDKWRIFVEAHTDAVGSDGNNQILSQNRANAVITALGEKGLPNSQMSVSVYGERRPVADNESDKGRQQNRRATIAIYEIQQLAILKGEIKDEKSGEGIQADLVIRSKTYRDTVKTDSLGKFLVPVPDNTVLGVDVYAKGYFFKTQMLKTKDGKSLPLEIELPPAEAGESVDIQNLYFVGNQAVLLKKSEPELPKVLKFMQLNKDIKIEIAGHVNYPNRPPVTRDSWEYDLSVRRAKLVYDYLLENNINSERLKYQGYGNYEMRFPKARSEREQALNRRVEIRVLED